MVFDSRISVKLYGEKFPIGKDYGIQHRVALSELNLRCYLMTSLWWCGVASTGPDRTSIRRFGGGFIFPPGAATVYRARTTQVQGDESTDVKSS